MKVLGCIIAGGKSSRMGHEKALIKWRGKALIEWVAARLSHQVEGMIVNANGDLQRFSFLNVPIIADRNDVGTPLAGLSAALGYAQVNGFDALLSVPCDTPLLPDDLRARLEGPVAAIATSLGQSHYLHGFWPISTLAQISGLRRVKDFAEITLARQEEWNAGGTDPFYNVNTPQDLSELP